MSVVDRGLMSSCYWGEGAAPLCNLLRIVSLKVAEVEFVFMAALGYEFRSLVQERLLVGVHDRELLCEAKVAPLRFAVVCLRSVGY